MADTDSGVPRRPTINEVAEAAGVSRSTTGRALRGTGYVASDVRDRVVAAAEALGYIPNAMASSLRSQESRSLGVIVSDLRDPFYSEVAAGIAHRAHAAGYTMVLIDDRGSKELELEAAATLVGMRVAGIILTPLSSAVSDYISRQRVPRIEADRTFVTDADTVLVDSGSATTRLIELLLSLGHRRIAMLADETGWTTGAARLQGYRDTLISAGIPIDTELIVAAGTTVQTARSTAIRTLTATDAPTAFFCANSVIAEGLWRASVDLGLRIPEDLSIVAFDDAPWMSLVHPGITTVAQPAELIGERAVECLLQRLIDPVGVRTEVMLEATIEARGSTAPPRRR